MLSMLESIQTGFYKYVTGIALAGVRRELLTRSDRFLAAGGFSRDLLEQGVTAWPWQTTDVDTEANSTSLTDCVDKQALDELDAYSVPQPADPALSRVNVKHAVRCARSGLDNDDYRHIA